MTTRLLTLTVALFVSVHGLWQPQSIDDTQLNTIKQWTTLSYDFPWDWPRGNREFYAPDQVVATGIEVFGDRIFLATPRLFSGVPATLSVLNKADDSLTSSVLQAYPNWGHHMAGLKAYNCSDIGLVSVYRLKIDSCNRLWALDAGVSRSLEDFEVTCPPKILIYDLHSDQVVRRIDFPSEVIGKDSLFTNMVIDDSTSRPENNCDDVFIYITDTVDPALVVYDSGRDLTWRVSHPSMFADPDFAESRIKDDSFTLMDGVVGLALDIKTGTVYFQPFASDRLFSVSTKALRAGPLGWGATLPVKLVGKKSSQGIGLAVSPKSGSVLFSPMTETALGAWNPFLTEQSVLAVDEERIQFVADIAIPKHDPGNIYVLSSRFHRFFLKNLDKNDINVRIMRMRDVTKDTRALVTPPLSLITRTPGFTKAPVPTVTTTFAVPTAPSTFSTSFSGFSLKPFPSTVAPYTFSTHRHLHNHPFSVTKLPYPFESVGVVNKAVRNPFLLLNAGERPSLVNDIHRNYNIIHSGGHESSSAHASSYFYTSNH